MTTLRNPGGTATRPAEVIAVECIACEEKRAVFNAFSGEPVLQACLKRVKSVISLPSPAGRGAGIEGMASRNGF